jgi:hypothetical protein
LDQSTGTGAIAQILPGAFKRALLGVVHPLLDQVLRNAGRRFLDAFFPASN